MIPWELYDNNKWRLSFIFSDSSSNCTTKRLFGKFTWSDNNNNVTDFSRGNNFLPERGMNQGLLLSESEGGFIFCVIFVDEPNYIKCLKWHLTSKWWLRIHTSPQKKFCYIPVKLKQARSTSQIPSWLHFNVPLLLCSTLNSSLSCMM